MHSGKFTARPNILALFATVLIWSGTQAMAAPGDEIGSAVRIVNVVTAEYETDARNLATGDNVRQDELIEVSSDGTGELRLRDDTKVALGPGSRLLLDEFVYNPDLDGGAIILNLVKGTFRFITGLAAKPAYVIRTPTAWITVRGTIFDIYVQDSGLSWLLLIEGAIEVCNERDECRLHDEPGKLIRITPDGDLGSPVTWASLRDKQNEPFDIAFPFVVAPPLIDPDPIFTPDDIIGGDDYSDGPDTGNEVVTPVRPPPPPPIYCRRGWFEIDATKTQSYVRRGYKVVRRRKGNWTIWCASKGGRPPPPPPIDCRSGWFEIDATKTNSYVRKGYKVRRRREGNWTIWCAQNGTTPLPLVCPPPAIGKLPFCKCGPGYRGKWPKCREIEPPPCKRGDVECECKRKGLPYNRRTGKCGTEPPPDPKKECLKKGWNWKGNRCVRPTSPKEECLKKGWNWTGNRCVNSSGPKEECLKKGWKWKGKRCVNPSAGSGPKQACLKKGWKWKGKRCVNPSAGSGRKQACLKKGWKWKGKRCVNPSAGSGRKQACLKKGWKWKGKRCVNPSAGSGRKQACLKKGWKWKGKRCVNPN